MYELEEKYLLDNAFHETKIKIPGSVFQDIHQIYCQDYRIRSVTIGSEEKFYFNKKIPSNIYPKANVEIETEITKDIFDDLKLNAVSELFKYRLSFSVALLRGDFNYDIDQFYYVDVLGEEHIYLKTMEIERPITQQTSTFPGSIIPYILGRFEKPSNHTLSTLNPKDVYDIVHNNLIKG